jgi:hypothetical protein
MTDANIRTIIGCVPRVPSCSDPNLILGTEQAAAILDALVAAGFKVLAREPILEMLRDGRNSWDGDCTISEIEKCFHAMWDAAS